MQSAKPKGYFPPKMHLPLAFVKTAVWRRTAMKGIILLAEQWSRMLLNKSTCLLECQIQNSLCHSVFPWVVSSQTNKTDIFFSSSFFTNKRTLYHGTLACLWAGLGWVCVRVLGPKQDICLTLTLSLLSPRLCVAAHTYTWTHTLSGL